jgi:DNA modification methylase
MTWHPDMPEHYRNAIITGDARELAAAIPDASVDLVFTDPVYDRIDDYAWLAETAARVLKPNSAVLAFCGIGYLNRVMIALASALRYRWALGVFQPNAPSRGNVYLRGFSKWYCCLWFDKGFARPPHMFPDMLESVSGTGWVGDHKWRKNPAAFTTWLRAFTRADSVVLDPFTGGGTVPAVCKMLGRNYLAFEIDPATAARARVRVEQTQAMHPVLLGVQEPMELAV